MPQRFDPNDYIDTQERIKRFRAEYPEGALTTEIVWARDYDSVVILAKVYRQLTDPLPASTGIAGEERGADYKAGANFTSWHENAETSAIGRALANFGYATSLKDRPSKQEMEKVARGNGQALAQREAATPPAEKPVAQAKGTDFGAEEQPTPIITPLGKLHGIAKLRGIQGEGKKVHEPLRCVCQFLLPKVKTEHGYEPLVSMTQLSDANLEWLYKQIEDADETALLLMAVDYPAAIKAATTLADLKRIAADLSSIGAKNHTHPELLRAWKDRKTALEVSPNSSAA